MASHTSTTLNCICFALAVLFAINTFVALKVHKLSSIQETTPVFHKERITIAPNDNSSSRAYVPIIIHGGHLNFYNSSDYLPEALQLPVFERTYGRDKNCCVMASLRGQSSPPKDIECVGICHTDRACNDPLYPHRSEEEASFFQSRDSNITELKKQCNEMNSLLQPPYRWCQQWMLRVNTIETITNDDINFDKLNQYSHDKIDPYLAGLPPPGCSIVSEAGRSGSYQHLILFPSAKLAFCGIPKISITQWLRFLRFTFGAKDFQAFPHVKADVMTMRFDKLNEQSQREILNDPEWKFAAFLRNPAERLLSAYLDKVNGTFNRERFQILYNVSYTLSFDEFVNEIAKNRTSCLQRIPAMREKLWGVDWCTDPHWRPQTFSCGLSEFLPRFSFIGSLDRIESQALAMLQEVGLWENYGRYYHWNNKERKLSSMCSEKPPSMNVGDELFGFMQHPRLLNRSNGLNNETTPNQSYRFSDHSTQSQSKLDHYYTPKLLELVEKKLYPNDVKLWKLIVDEPKMLTGSELAIHLSDKCKARALQLTSRVTS